MVVAQTVGVDQKMMHRCLTFIVLSMKKRTYQVLHEAIKIVGILFV
jgi:hypothetical protein